MYNSNIERPSNPHSKNFAKSSVSHCDGLSPTKDRTEFECSIGSASTFGETQLSNSKEDGGFSLSDLLRQEEEEMWA